MQSSTIFLYLVMGHKKIPFMHSINSSSPTSAEAIPSCRPSPKIKSPVPSMGGKDCINSSISQRNQTQKFTSVGIKEKNESQQLYNIIFGPIKRAFKSGIEIQVYNMAKANGENAQVSYCSKLDCWVIASKNVSILAQSKDDIELYKGDRFNFARLIAIQWFITLEKMTADKLSTLKTDLTNKTLVGEYCGNQDYQHLVKYSKIEICWFAITDFNLPNSCIPVQKAMDFFQNYNLEAVKWSSLGKFATFQDLNNALLQRFNKISESSIEDENEGSVLYFEGDSKVLGLCKLKTLEYRIFRKLREKLRTLINSKQQKEKISQSYREEVQQLCQHNKPKESLNFYFSVAEMAFNFVICHPKESYLVHQQYLTFLTMVQYCYQNSLELKPQMFTKSMISKVKEISWASMKGQTIDVEVSDERIIQPRQQNSIASNKTVYVLIPIGIPGMGKSTLFLHLHQQLSSSQTMVISISSDKIRERLITDQKKRMPKLKTDELFSRTAQNANREFESQVFKAFSLFASSPQKSKMILILDKNHPPNGINKSVNLIRKNNQFEIKILAILPKLCDGQIKLPFSWTFIFKCIQRVQQRKQHETLPGNGTESLQLLIMFLAMFRNFDFQEFSHLFDFAIQIDFEGEALTLQEDCKQLLTRTILSVNSDFKCTDNLLLIELNHFLETHQCLDQFNQQKIKNEIKNKLLGLIDSEIQEKGESQQQIIEPKQHLKQNAPLYIGIFTEYIQAKQKISNMLNDVFAQIKNNFSQDLDFKLIEKQYHSNNLFKWVESLHVTTLFIGSNQQLLNTDCFTQFQRGLKHNLAISTVFLSPFNIITALVEQSSLQVPVQNKHPHMTLMIQNSKPKDSNELISKTLEQGHDLTNGKKLTILMYNKKTTVFALKLQSNLEIEGLSDYFIPQ